MIKNVEFYAEKAQYGRLVRIWLTSRSHDMEMDQVAMPVKMVGNHEGELVDPTIEILASEAQGLIDALWSIGLRPANGEGMDAQVSAIKRHLEDMRTLVFKDHGA